MARILGDGERRRTRVFMHLKNLAYNMRRLVQLSRRRRQRDGTQGRSLPGVGGEREIGPAGHGKTRDTQASSPPLAREFARHAELQSRPLRPVWQGERQGQGKEPAVAIAAVTVQPSSERPGEDEYIATPLFVSIRSGITLIDHDGRQA